MWPKLTNIDSNIVQKIKSYSNNPDTSKLNAWIRIFSGAEMENSKQPGLILQSNTDYKLFRATGDNTQTIYGDLQSSGILGSDWNGNSVESGIGRRLRPSPIVTSFEVKEGKDQISRAATIQLKCFSLEQMEKLQTYLLEPGYSLFVEWGWNTFNGVKNITTVKGDSLEIVNNIADKSLSWESLSDTRKSSDGEYDCFLGFIVGGNISGEGENFDITVNLRGAPSLPTYLQSNQGITQIDPNNGLAISRKVKELFKTPELENANVGLRRFARMFNDLPSISQTIDVYALKDKADPHMFINFDDVIKKQINNGLGEPWYIPDSEEVDIKIDGQTFSIAKDKLFSDKRYVRMDLVVLILNAMGALDSYKIGDKEITFKININNTVIGSYPYQYSAKSDKLIIASTIPDFLSYYIQQDTIEQSNSGVLRINDKEDVPPILNKDQNANFRPAKELNNYGYKEDAGYWGYLKFLFVNFELFKSKIEQKNKNIREIFLDILNEMSSAVNSFWNFQIVEGAFEANVDGGLSTQYEKIKKGDIILTVIDENFIGKNPKPDEVVYFRHVGNGSVFLDANLDISMPAEKTNQIVMERLKATSQPDEHILKVGKFFNGKTDLFLSRVTDTGTGNNSTTGSSAAPTTVEQKQNEFDTAQTEVKNALEEKNNFKGDKYTNFGFTLTEEYGAVVKRYNDAVNERNKKSNELREAKKEAQTAATQAKADSINLFLDKLDVFPNPKWINFGFGTGDLTNIEKLKDKTYIKDYFVAYTFDDTEYLDRLKREGTEELKETLSAPLPIRYSFKILGNSGIRRGDMFKISGIPAKYAKHGIFQVTEIAHNLEGNSWFTNITGQYRQEQ